MEKVSAKQIMLLADGADFVWHTIIMKVIFQSKAAIEKLRKSNRNLGSMENKKNQKEETSYNLERTLFLRPHVKC